MREESPAGFVEFVIARGPALYRTALLLAGREQAAEKLAQIALAKAWLQERDAPMKRTLEDVHSALHQEADDAAYPDIDALLAGARGRVAAARRRPMTSRSASGTTPAGVSAFPSTPGLPPGASAPHRPARRKGDAKLSHLALAMTST